MKRTVAVLAMVLALAFPVAAHAGSSGPGSSTGTCAATHEYLRSHPMVPQPSTRSYSASMIR